MNGVDERMYNGLGSGYGIQRPAMPPMPASVAPPGHAPGYNPPLHQKAVPHSGPPPGSQGMMRHTGPAPNPPYSSMNNQMQNMQLRDTNPQMQQNAYGNQGMPQHVSNYSAPPPPMSQGQPAHPRMPPPHQNSMPQRSTQNNQMMGHPLRGPMPGYPPSSSPAVQQLPFSSHQPPYAGQSLAQPQLPPQPVSYSQAPTPNTQFPPQQSQPAYGGPPAPYNSQPAPFQNQQAQQPRKLDPDAMPSPVQVLEADRVRSSEPFRTDSTGLAPPLVTTKFQVEDCGSASPSYIRCATYSLPCSVDIAKLCQVPMALSVKPLARLPQSEHPPHVVDPGPEGPVRCKRCKAYMCPQFKFTDGGRRFQCGMCSAVTDTPHHYFEHVDHMNQRVDKYQRPELCRGSYEYLVTKDYCKNDQFPNPPAYIFAIDVSYNAVKSGLVDLLCRNLKDLLDHLPCDVGCNETAVRIALFTYDSTLHFYNLKSTLAQPQMLVVSDVSDIFVPLQDGFLVSLKESRHVINRLLDQIPEMFADTRESEVVLGPVLKAAIQALESASCPGKLFLFLTTMPTTDAPGKLKNRDDRKLIGTDKEKTLFSPAGNFYTGLARECVAKACCVDLYLFPNQYMDVATIGQVAQLTGGDIFKYNLFRPNVDGERLISNLACSIQRNMAFDAILRVRTSAGIRAVNFAGALSMSNTTDVELAGLDCDKAIAVELKHDDKISEELGAHIQVAFLYTSVGGQRRLRVHNLNLAVCNQVSDLFRSCEADVLINYMAKTAIQSGLSHGQNKIREELISRVTNILAAYRKHCASPSSAGQLILPECLKLLPVYLNSMLKNDSIHSSHEISTDDKAYLRQLVLGMDVAQTQVFFYPRLLPVRSFSPPDLPTSVRCSEDRLKETEAYVLDNGISCFLWIGNAIDPEWLKNVFGVQSTAQIDIDMARPHAFDNGDSEQLRHLLKAISTENNRSVKLAVIRQRDKLEPWFKHFLVEDRSLAGGASYVDFLCHIHKEIRTILA